MQPRTSFKRSAKSSRGHGGLQVLDHRVRGGHGPHGPHGQGRLRPRVHQGRIDQLEGELVGGAGAPAQPVQDGCMRS
jgi:hypothetical protein